MKTCSLARPNQPSAAERGVAIISVLIITSILLLLVAANIRTIGHLHKSLNLIEQKQLKDLHTTKG